MILVGSLFVLYTKDCCVTFLASCRVATEVVKCRLLNVWTSLMPEAGVVTVVEYVKDAGRFAGLFTRFAVVVDHPELLFAE